MPDSFSMAVVAGPRPALDVAAARRQHAAYRAALEAAGFATIVLEADEGHPDSPFVEDTAVLLGDVALVTRPGAPSRRGETGPVADALDDHFRLVRVEEPATVDGGDVLIAGGKVFVGRSGRTNDDGIGSLAKVAAPAGLEVVPVAVHGVLHLKSAVTALDEGTLFGARGRVDAAPFAHLDWIDVPAGEEQAANVVALGGGRVLVPAGHPRAADTLADAGYEPVPVDVAEFAAADGGLTCLSLRW